MQNHSAELNKLVVLTVRYLPDKEPLVKQRLFDWRAQLVSVGCCIKVYQQQQQMSDLALHIQYQEQDSISIEQAAVAFAADFAGLGQIQLSQWFHLREEC